MSTTKFWIAPALIIKWGSMDLHPVIFNADRTVWVPATHNDNPANFPIRNWNMGRHLPGSRRKNNPHDVGYLAMKHANSRLTNVGQFQPVPEHVVEQLEKAFKTLN